MKIFDTHNDCLTALKNFKDIKNYINNISKSKIIKKAFCVIWTTKLKNPLKYISQINNLVLKENVNKKIILCIEDLGFINKNNFNQAIELLKNIKPFYCGLVWNYDNALGGGTYGKGGLKQLGQKVISQLESYGIFIDTAHMNRKTFNNFIKITTKPILNSHCNFDFYNRHKRNLSNIQIKNIINSEGQICLSFVNDFISDKLIDLSIIAEQVAIFVKNFGYINLSIGTDMYGTDNLPIDFKNYLNFKTLKIELKKRGFSNKIINSIFYKNMSKFYYNNKI